MASSASSLTNERASTKAKACQFRLCNMWHAMITIAVGTLCMGRCSKQIWYEVGHEGDGVAEELVDHIMENNTPIAHVRKEGALLAVYGWLPRKFLDLKKWQSHPLWFNTDPLWWTHKTFRIDKPKLHHTTLAVLRIMVMSPFPTL